MELGDSSNQHEKLQEDVLGAVQKHYQKIFTEEVSPGLRKFVDPCEYLDDCLQDEASLERFAQGMQDLECKLTTLVDAPTSPFQETIPAGLPNNGVSCHRVQLWKMACSCEGSVKGHHTNG